MKKLGLLVIVGFLATMISCGKDYKKFEGTFVRSEKIDAADKSVFKYKTNAKRGKLGMKISQEGDIIIATTVVIKDGKSINVKKHSKVLKLKQTDDEIFQYRGPKDENVLTFYFRDGAMQIAEYQRQKDYVLEKQSDINFKRVK